MGAEKTKSSFPQHFYIDTNLGEGEAQKDKPGGRWFVSLPHQVFTFAGYSAEVRAEIVRRVKTYNESADSDRPTYSRIFGQNIPCRRAFTVR
tara:strand:+ start:3130 stop:3405 length:276 start_codon:yes stop_codon:yes gene_type:complete